MSTAAKTGEKQAPRERRSPAVGLAASLRSRAPPIPPRDEWRKGLSRWFARQCATEAAARSGFHLVPVAMIAGVAIIDGIGWRPHLLPLVPVAILLLVLAFTARGRPLLWSAVIAVGFAAAGAGLATLELDRTSTTIFSGEATVHVTGRVLSRETDERGRQRYLVAIERTDRPVLSRPPETARVVVGSRHVPIEPGGVFDALVRLRPPSGPVMPGAHDFAFAPYFEGIGAYGFTLGAPTPAGRTAEASPAKGFTAAVASALTRLRLAMTERIRTAVGGPEGAVAAALITGERAGIPGEVETWLRRTGLAHVLSISGLHLAIVAGFALLLVRSLLAFIPALSLNLPAKKIAAIFALAVAVLYLAISSANVATQRAAIMLAIMLTAAILDRPALTLRNVSIAAIVVVAFSPHAVMTASFQMSFAATVALVGGYAALARFRSGRADHKDRRGGVMAKAGRALGAIALTSLFAGAATAPFAAYHFQRLAAFGLAANLLTMPIFSLWIMPLALVGCLLMPFGLDVLPLRLMGLGVDAVLRVAETLAHLLPDQAVGRVTIGGLLLLIGAILVASCLASSLRWVALPLALLGMLLAPERGPLPELLIFEDGKEIARVDADGGLAFLRERPNGFVADQWRRAFPQGSREPGRVRHIPARCEGGLCRFRTRSGFDVAWTQDWKLTGTACDAGDIAIVARAVRIEACRSGAILATLRTLRKSGSLAIVRGASGTPEALRSIPDPPPEWNRHRWAPWPEYWKKPAETIADAGSRGEADAARTAAASAGPKPSGAKPAGPESPGQAPVGQGPPATAAPGPRNAVPVEREPQ